MINTLRYPTSPILRPVQVNEELELATCYNVLHFRYIDNTLNVQI